MESTWYLFPGQTLENTKISERSHALHITNAKWGKITKHLDRKKLIQESLDREEQWKKYLQDGSKSMTQEWDSSIENIRKRKEEERLRKAQKTKEDRMQTYFELKKEQDKVRKEYIDKARKKIFMNRGHAKELTSAFIQGEVLFEREKQKEFKKFLENRQKEVEAEYAEKVKEDAKLEMEEKIMEKVNELEKKRNHGELLKKMINDKEEHNKKAMEQKITEEAMDNIRSAEELECLKLQEEKEKAKRTQLLYAEHKRREEVANERKILLQREEQELDEVVSIYQDAKFNIDCLRKAREIKIREEMAARRDAVAKLVTAEVESHEEEERRVMEKAIAERDAEEEAKIKAKIEHVERAKRDRIEDRKKFLEREEAQKAKELELKKWEMINRYKSEQEMQEYDKKKKHGDWQQVLNYRKQLLEQMATKEEEVKKEKELDRIIAKVSFDEEDKKFFDYAYETLEMSKAKGRPTYPMERVIQKYKTEFNIKDDRAGNGTTVDKTEQAQKLKRKSKCKCNIKYR